MNQILLVGLSHRTSPLALREQLALAEDSLEPALHVLSQAGMSEVIALMTCNRLEIYGVGPGREEIEAFLAARSHLSLGDLRQHLYIETGAGAVRHLMRVAAGLDSMILGEQQILGQVQAAFEVAQAAGATGPVLSRLFAQAAYIGWLPLAHFPVSRTVSRMARSSRTTSGSDPKPFVSASGALICFSARVQY